MRRVALSSATLAFSLPAQWVAGASAAVAWLSAATGRRLGASARLKRERVRDQDQFSLCTMVLVTPIPHTHSHSTGPTTQSACVTLSSFFGMLPLSMPGPGEVELYLAAWV